MIKARLIAGFFVRVIEYLHLIANGAKINKNGGFTMYIASMNFGDYRKGDEVPTNLPNNDERLARGLIREVKVIKPEEVKAVEVKTVTPEEPKAAKNVVRKPKNETKPAE